MIDEEGVLSKLNKSKRKQLVAFLKQHDTDSARIIPASELPKNSKQDRGMVAVIMAGQNIWHEQYKDFYVLIDTLDKDGQENFQQVYKRQSVILELLGVGQHQQEKGEPSYNPKEFYLVPKAGKQGRPRRVLTDSEKAKIDELRQQGKGINAIAKALHIGAKRVQEYLKQG